MGPLRRAKLTKNREWDKQDAENVSAPPPIPDDVAFPELPFRTEAAHTLPVQEDPLLRQRPHHAVPGCDLGQWVRTVNLYGSGTGAIHAETCRGEGQEAPKDTQSGLHTSFSFCLLTFLFWYFAISFHNEYFLLLRSTQHKIVRLCLNIIST